ncbi:MAG: HEAT repeat domain-containing protein [Gemmatimonadaceae bacterium]|nr:HEAT repeat domain-containing protein [Gemmatimonadaceae bacterium]
MSPAAPSFARAFAQLVYALGHDASGVDRALEECAQAVATGPTQLTVANGRWSGNGAAVPKSAKGAKELAKRWARLGDGALTVSPPASADELRALAAALAAPPVSGETLAALLVRLGVNAGAFRANEASGPSNAPDDEPQTEPVTEPFTEPLTEPAIASAPDAGAVALPEPTPTPTPEPAPEPSPPAAPDPAPDPDESEDTLAIPEATDATHRVSTERIDAILALAAPGTSATHWRRILEELEFIAEQCIREGLTERAADLLERLLDVEAGERDEDVRRAFIVAMRKLSAPPVVRPLAELFIGAPERAAQLERIIARLGIDGVEVLADLRASASSPADATRIDALLGTLPALPVALTGMAEDARWWMVRDAADLIGIFRPAGLERVLGELLAHKDVRVRRSAVLGLATYDVPFAFDALVRATADEAPLIRASAVDGLSARRVSRAASVLVKLSESETDDEVLFALFRALGRLATPDAVQRLVALAEADAPALRRRAPGLRLAVVLALADARTSAAMVALQQLAQDKERDVRDAAARGLRAGVRRTTAMPSVPEEPPTAR